MTYKVILFDHDDTLVETLKPKWAQHKYIAHTFYNKELNEDDLRLHWGKPLPLMLKELYKTNDIAQATAYNVAAQQIFPKTLFPETSPVIEALRLAGKVLGIVTATTRPNLDYDFSTMNIQKGYFDYIQTQEDSDFHKPDPRVFQPTKSWLSEKGYCYKDVLYIGDALTDLKAARQAKFEFMGTCTGLVSAETFKAYGVTALNSLSDLLSLLSLK